MPIDFQGFAFPVVMWCSDWGNKTRTLHTHEELLPPESVLGHILGSQAIWLRFPHSGSPNLFEPPQVPRVEGRRFLFIFWRIKIFLLGSSLESSLRYLVLLAASDIEPWNSLTCSSDIKWEAERAGIKTTNGVPESALSVVWKWLDWELEFLSRS